MPVISCTTRGWWSTAAMRSPRETSSWSASRSTTDWGAKATSCSSGRPGRRGRRAVDADDRGSGARRQHDDLVADVHHPGGQPAGIPPVVAVLGALRADDVLDRHPERLCRRVGSRPGRTRGTRGGWARRTRRRGRTGRRRCRRTARTAAPPGRRRSRSALPAGRTRRRCSSNAAWSQSTRSILLTASGDVPHAQQPGHGEVPAGLLDDPVAGVDEDERQLGGGRAGDHVAGVLDVARGVGEDVGPRWRWRSTGRRRRW